MLNPFAPTSLPQRWPNAAGPICRVAWVAVAGALTVAAVFFWRMMDGWEAGILFALYAGLAMIIRARPWPWVAAVVGWGVTYRLWSAMVVGAAMMFADAVLPWGSEDPADEFATKPFSAELSIIITAAGCGGLTALVLWRATRSRAVAISTLAASAAAAAILILPLSHWLPGRWAAYADEFGLWHLVVSAALLTWAGRRARDPSLCPACNYDRTGLPAGAPCPECGHSTPAR